MLKQFREMSVKDQWDVMFKAIGLVSILLAAFATWYTYSKDVAQRLSDAQKQAFQLYILYISPNFSADRQALAEIRTDASRLVADQIKTISNANAASSERERLLKSITMNAILTGKKGESARRIIGFFDQAAICVEIHQCDRVGVYRLFHEEAYLQYEALSDLIAQWRLTQPDLGRGMEALSAANYIAVVRQQSDD
jgi:hypothetical protein